jgi:hypothetical protein
LNRWSTRVPVELSNRDLHREGWGHDGDYLKVAVAENESSATAAAPPSRGTLSGLIDLGPFLLNLARLAVCLTRVDLLSL